MLKISRPARSLLLLGFISCLLLFTLTSRYGLLDGQTARRHLQSRQFPIIGTGDDKTTTTSAPTTPTQASATTQPATSAAPQTSAQQTPTQTSAAPTATQTSNTDATPSQTSATSSLPQESSTSAQTSAPPPTQTSEQPTPTPVQQTSTSLSTGSNGEVETIIATVVVTPSLASSSAQPSQSSDADNSNTGTKGVGTSTIVGLSVAGGVALIVVIGFIVWKFTRKRAGDDFDDSEFVSLSRWGSALYSFRVRKGNNQYASTSDGAPQISKLREDYSLHGGSWALRCVELGMIYAQFIISVASLVVELFISLHPMVLCTSFYIAYTSIPQIPWFASITSFRRIPVTISIM